MSAGTGHLFAQHQGRGGFAVPADGVQKVLISDERHLCQLQDINLVDKRNCVRQLERAILKEMDSSMLICLSICIQTGEDVKRNTTLIKCACLLKTVMRPSCLFLTQQVSSKY